MIHSDKKIAERLKFQCKNIMPIAITNNVELESLMDFKFVVHTYFKSLQVTKVAIQRCESKKIKYMS